MAEKCPRCGSTNTKWYGGSKRNAKYVCRDCGKRFSLNTGRDSKRFENISINERLVKTVLFGGIALYLIFLFPMGSSIRGMFEAIIPEYDWVFWGSILLFMYTLINSIWTSNSNGVGISYLLLIAVIIIASNIGLTYIESIEGQQFITSTKCSISALISGNTDISDCIQPSGPDEPGPITSTDAITLDFDNDNSEYTIYKTTDDFNVKPFFILLTVENPSDTRDVENFQISSTKSIIRKGEGPTNGRIEIAHLKTSDNSCMDNNGCDLEAGDKIELVIKAESIGCDSEEQIECETYDICEWDEDSATCSILDEDIDVVEAILSFSYDYAVENTRDLLLSKDYTTIQSMIDNTETPSSTVEGPLYLGVSFAPSYYVFEDDDESAEINMNIKISNEGEGEGYISEPISITRIVGGNLLVKPDICTDPWGQEIILDNDEKIIIDDGINVEGSVVFTCTYTVKGSSVRENGEVIPITATSKYTYEDEKYKTYIRVEEL